MEKLIWRHLRITINLLNNSVLSCCANGNILTQKRSDQAQHEMEDLTYRYKRNEAGQIMQNRLYHVNDADIVHNTLYTDDIEDQGAFPTDTENSVWNEDFNYGYTEIGELLRDNAEDIEQIVWRVDSKIAYIYRSDESTKKELGFEYDAMGNRIAKHIYSAMGVWEKSTFYIREASGSVMATYEETIELINIDADPELEEVIDYDCIERPIYGSSRLGMETTLIELVEANAPSSSDAQRTLGYKQYELSNHLGNVLAVINDMKLPVLDGTLIVSYSAVMVSATDYSPFGVGLYGRSWSSEVYRYGFNGKEKDDEGMGGGSQTYDYGFRIYNPALAKFLSVDPLFESYAWYTPYQFAGNKPIIAIDLDGLEEKVEIIPNPNIYTQAHFDFITNVAPKIYQKSIELGLSAHGAAIVCAMAWNESAFGTSGPAKNRNNFFGIDRGNASYSSPEDCVAAFFTLLGREDRYPEYIKLLKSTTAISSDDINRTTNSGPYIKSYKDFDDGAFSYNDDRDNNEPTKVLYLGVTSGMQDYGNQTLNSLKTMVGAYIQRNTNMIEEYKTWNAYGELQLEKTDLPQEERERIKNDIEYNKKQIENLNAQNAWVKATFVITDTGTTKSTNSVPQDSEKKVEYKNNIQTISSNGSQ